MRAELRPKDIGRIAAYLFIASGVLSTLVLPLPQLPGINRGAVLVVSGIAVVAGGIAWLMPWERWSRRATLVLLPVALVIIALGNYFGSARSYSYSVFFIVAFVWVGISHPRWTSVWFAPLAAIAYITPILMRGADTPADASAAGLTIPVCILVAEILAWIVEGERKTRERAQSLSRIAGAVGHHLNEERLCESLVEEARTALRSEHAILYQIDPDTSTYTATFTSGLGEAAVALVKRQIGTTVQEMPEEMLAGNPRVVEDTGADERDRNARESFNVKSYIVIPVMARGVLVGALFCAEASKPRKYHPDEIVLASALAGHASAAFQNAKLYQQTLAASRSDPLTGLGNRRAFRERLDSEVERARRYGRDLSLVVLDVDRFKSVNDTLGHQAGDRLLARLAGLLQRNRRMEDGAFRIGGDEFALVLPETGVEGGTAFAERLRRRIERSALGGERDIPVTVSVGLGSFAMHGINADELFDRADTALFEVKGAGGNAVAILPETSGEDDGLRLGVDIESIVGGRHLRSVYQPIFDLRTGTVLGFETFCRLDPAFGHTPTPTLFRAASKAGRLQVLDRLCREIALEGASALGAQALLFLNISPAALEADDFEPSEIMDVAALAGLSVDRLVIEVTELERTASSKRLVRGLRACSEAGMMIALDDFGAAGADLDLLAGMKFDFVKVDMSFVQGANGVETRRRVLRGLALLAVEAGAQAIAEGIESLDDLRLVRELGFSGGQGFFLRDPTPEPDHSPRPLRLLGNPEPAPAT